LAHGALKTTASGGVAATRSCAYVETMAVKNAMINATFIFNINWDFQFDYLPTTGADCLL